MNCINFEYDDCNFSKKQMNSKDRKEQMTKEGSGRVQVYRLCNIIHSYTLECGFHQSNDANELAPPIQSDKKYGNDKQYSFVEDSIEDVKGSIYQNGPPLYTVEIFENIGKNLLVSILDIFDKNPYSRILNSSYKNMDIVRREVALQVSKLDRFKKEEGKLMTKCKKITDFINETFYNVFLKVSVPPPRSRRPLSLSRQSELSLSLSLTGATTILRTPC